MSLLNARSIPGEILLRTNTIGKQCGAQKNQPHHTVMVVLPAAFATMVAQMV
jgi:hypothetical protein